MKPGVLLLCVWVTSAALHAFAQTSQDVVKRGEEVFAQSCTGYCHAPRGAGGGGAPRLAARGFDQAFINTVVARGVPGTTMAGFGSSLPSADLTAVVAYVGMLNGMTTPTITPPAGRGLGPAPPLPDRSLSPEASRGRELFFDATRSVHRCSTCHEVNGRGIPVAGPVSDVPDSVAALRALATPLVSTVTIKGESMPGLVLSRNARSVLFYDLTKPPPVLVTAESSSVTIAGESPWRHVSVAGSYTDDELESILRFLRETK